MSVSANTDPTPLADVHLAPTAPAEPSSPSANDSKVSPADIAEPTRFQKPAWSPTPTDEVFQGTIQTRLQSLFSLLYLSFMRQIRSQRLFVLVVVFLLPVVGVLIGPIVQKEPTAPRTIETNLVFYIIAQGLIPLAALIYSAGLVHDEVEEQTLTYLLLRPIPRWSIYVTKVLAAFLVTALVITLFTYVTYLLIYWQHRDLLGRQPLWDHLFPWGIGKTALLLSLALGTYLCVFCMLTVLLKRALALCIVYFLSVEIILGNWDLPIRQLTITYYFRVAIKEWRPELTLSDWSITHALSPEATSSIAILFITCFLSLTIGAAIYDRLEFRMKARGL